MALVPKTESSAVPLSEIFTDMPAVMRSSMGRGFQTLATFPVDVRKALADDIAKTVTFASDTDVEKFATKIGVDEETASSVISSASLLVALATSRTESPEVLVEALAEAKIVNASGIAASLEILKSLSADRDQLKRSARIESLANETLPAFRALHTSIDPRVSVKTDQIDLFAPTVVAHLQTDHNQTNMFFQMTKIDVERLQDQVKSILEQIAVAEKWAKGRA